MPAAVADAMIITDSMVSEGMKLMIWKCDICYRFYELKQTAVKCESKGIPNINFSLGDEIKVCDLFMGNKKGIVKAISYVGHYVEVELILTGNYNKDFFDPKIRIYKDSESIIEVTNQ